MQNNINKICPICKKKFSISYHKRTQKFCSTKCSSKNGTNKLLEYIKNKRKKALILLSGGQDSTTCLAWAINRWGVENVQTLSFLYGQRHKEELDIIDKLVKKLKVKHYTIDITNIFLSSNSALIKEDTEIKKVNGIPNTYVPGRNLIFLSIASSLAYELGIYNIVIGVTTSDFWVYLPLSWGWLVGFFEAEGCFTFGEKRKSISISISQNDVSILKKIQEFLWRNNINSNVCCQDGKHYTLYIDSLESTNLFIRKVVPLLRTDKKKYKYDKLQKIIPNLQNIKIRDKNITWDWLVGFWEGDGSVCLDKKYYQQVGKKCPIYYFYQNEKNILLKIRDFLGVGNVSDGSLQVYDLKQKRISLYNELIKRTQTKFRREQISKVYVSSEISGDNYKSAYPDCTPEFIFWMERAMKIGLFGNISIHTPLQYLTKSETVRLMEELGCFDWYKYTMTCYKGKSPACGVCPSCKLRIKGFQENKLVDPIEYEIDIDWGDNG